MFRDWHWWKLYTRVKPLLNTVKAEDELKAKDAVITDIKDKFEKEEKLRKDYESKCVGLLSEKNNLTLQLQAVGIKFSYLSRKLTLRYKARLFISSLHH